jgi:SAM-dependent methyltransferase
LQPHFYTQYAALERSHWWFLARAEILEAVLSQFVPPRRDRLLLETGCGTGGMRPLLSKFGRVVSTDFSAEALRFCRAQNLDFLAAADVTRLPFRSETFESACAFDVLEHLEDDAAAVREMHRVLKPRGLLFVTVPAFQFLWGRQDIVSQHFRRYNVPQLRDLLEQSQFSVLKLSYFNTFLFAPIATVRLSRRILGRNRGGQQEVRSDFEFPHSGALNRLLRRIFAAEKRFLQHGRLPFGVSLLCVAQKSS